MPSGCTTKLPNARSLHGGAHFDPVDADQCSGDNSLTDADADVDVDADTKVDANAVVTKCRTELFN